MCHRLRKNKPCGCIAYIILGTLNENCLDNKNAHCAKGSSSHYQVNIRTNSYCHSPFAVTPCLVIAGMCITVGFVSFPFGWVGCALVLAVSSHPLSPVWEVGVDLGSWHSPHRSAISSIYLNPQLTSSITTDSSHLVPAQSLSHSVLAAYLFTRSQPHLISLWTPLTHSALWGHTLGSSLPPKALIHPTPFERCINS